MNYEPKHKKYGLIWIAISPILWLMAAISTVESITFYYIQLTLFSVIAITGFIAGAASLFQSKLAWVVLRYLSWFSFIFFSGSGVAILIYGLVCIFKANGKTVAMVVPIGLGVVMTGLPFYYMARKLGIKNKVQK